MWWSPVSLTVNGALEKNYNRRNATFLEEKIATATFLDKLILLPLPQLFCKDNWHYPVCSHDKTVTFIVRRSVCQLTLLAYHVIVKQLSYPCAFLHSKWWFKSLSNLCGGVVTVTWVLLVVGKVFDHTLANTVI